MPVTTPSSIRTSSTVNASRSSVPASTAARTRRSSSTIRRGQNPSATPSTDRGAPESVIGPKSNEYFVIAGHPVASRRSRSPHRFSAATPGGWIMCVEIVSLGNVALSTSNTR
jgi:hypothetical protein